MPPLFFSSSFFFPGAKSGGNDPWLVVLVADKFGLEMSIAPFSHVVHISPSSF